VVQSYKNKIYGQYAGEREGKKDGGSYDSNTFSSPEVRKRGPG
jgi:hypothetical protein